jgi:hypothetical protein
MSIVVNPHNQQEEKALLAFLDGMKYDYSHADDAFFLSEAQQQEILDRDKQYEAGESETFTLNQVISHFGIKE